MSLTRAFALFLLFVSPFVLATDIEIITVSATPINLSEAGGSITVINRNDILSRNASTLAELLRSVPGFSLNQQGSAGAIAQLRVRGSEANQVLVLVDGIAANDLSQGSEFDFSQFSTRDIERIEIVRGAQSVLWGSDAMSGVINIITRPDVSDSTFEVVMEAGSFSTRHAGTSYRYGSESLKLQFTADHIESEGTNISRVGSEDDGFENTTVSFSGDYTIMDNLSLAFTARHTDKSTDFDGVDFFVTGLPTDADFETDNEHLFTGLKLNHDINDKLDHSLSVSRSKSDSVTKTYPGTRDIARGARNSATYQLNMGRENHTLSLLAGYEKEFFSQRGTASFFGDPNQNRKATERSIAAEYRYDSDALNLSASARRDNNSEFDDATSWRLTASTQLGGVLVHAAMGESIKNPTFTERFGFFTNFVGNPNLSPESSLQWEVGARSDWADNRLSASLTYFKAELEDEINGFYFDFASGGFTSVNVNGESERQGVEAEFSYDVTDNFSISANYTWLDATQDDGFGSQAEEVRRPEHSGSVGLSYTRNRLSLRLDVSHTGKQADDFFPPYPPFIERVELDAFTLVSINGQYQLNDLVLLTASLQNVTDKDYEQVFGFESPGFAAYGGLRISW